MEGFTIVNGKKVEGRTLSLDINRNLVVDKTPIVEEPFNNTEVNLEKVNKLETNENKYLFLKGFLCGSIITVLCLLSSRLKYKEEDKNV